MTGPRVKQVKERIGDKLVGQVRKAIEKYQAGDDINWDVGPLFNPQQPPAYFVCLIIPGALLGSSQVAGIIFPEAWHSDQDYVDIQISTALNQLREARSQNLAEAAQATAQAAVAEGQAPPSELILPTRR